METPSAGTLYVVSTPIGNLGDLSPRGEETLRAVTTILAEDTRRSRILTDRARSSARRVSLHEHNELMRTNAVLGWLAEGDDLALVSDAGTPLVSDPGAKLVAAVLEAGYRVVPVPGPSAVIAALVVSGLPSERFTFLGFPERKGSARHQLLRRVAESAESVVLYESPQRLVALLAALIEVCGPDRLVAVARELTKIHEEVRRGTLAEVAAYYDANTPKGEVTLVVGPSADDGREEDREDEARVLGKELLDQGMKPSQAAKEVAACLDLARNDAYRIVQDLDTEATSE
jgi:16S rRNA (cytidine1402-2'-O)-methyltransferase